MSCVRECWGGQSQYRQSRIDVSYSRLGTNTRLVSTAARFSNELEECLSIRDSGVPGVSFFGSEAVSTGGPLPGSPGSTFSSMELLSSARELEVLAAGDTVSKIGNYVSTLSFSIDEAAGDCYVNIFDQNNNIVETVELGALSAGDYSVTWDGKDYNGQAVSDGIYSVAMAAESTSGEPILINTQVSGKVRGVRVEGSEYMLTLEDGREVSLLQIERVITPNNNDAENQDEEES